MGAAAAIAGQNLGAGRPERSMQAVQVAARFGLMIAGTIGVIFLLVPRPLLGGLRPEGPTWCSIGRQLLRYLSVSGLFITVALDLHRRPAGHGRHQEPALHHARRADGVPLGLCLVCRRPARSRPRNLARHRPRPLHPVRALARRFHQGKWRTIQVGVAAAGAR